MLPNRLEAILSPFSLLCEIAGARKANAHLLFKQGWNGDDC
jgi:hypothetical protein